MRTRFHAEPMVQATELLLQEGEATRRRSGHTARGKWTQSQTPWCGRPERKGEGDYDRTHRFGCHAPAPSNEAATR